MMRSAALHPLALAVLLVQAAFGSLSPAGVICIRHGHTQPVERDVPAVTRACSEGECCVKRVSDGGDRPAVAIMSPCEADCPGCVDIGLPDHEMMTGDRAELLLAAIASLIPAPAGTEASLGGAPCPHVHCRAGPLATGPPQLAACPHAAVIRSTRLLV